MFLRKIQKKSGRRYRYVLKSVYDRKRGYPVHKRVANLSGLSDEIVLAVEKMLKGGAPLTVILFAGFAGSVKKKQLKFE